MTIKSNKEAYNKIADAWAESRDSSFLSKLVREFASHVKSGGNILDIGCGTGYPIASYLSEQGFKITGIDVSDKLLQKAIDRNLPNITLHLCDFFDFEPTDKYDGVIAFDSFFHFPKEKQRMIYERVAGWMNKDACLLFTHGSTEGEKPGEMFDEMFYYSALDKTEVLQLLTEAGLEIVWTKEMYVERDLNRDLVILAKKTTEKSI